MVINAHPIETATPFWEQLVLGFGPTILIVGIVVFIARRVQRMGAGGGLGSFGRSRAQRYEPDATAKRVSFDDVAGIDEAEEELVEVVDFLRNPRPLHAPRRNCAEGRAALGPAGHGQDAARAGGRRRGRGAVLLDLGIGVHRGDRRRRRQPRP